MTRASSVRARVRFGQTAVRPPSMVNTLPVIERASSLMRCTARAATSLVGRYRGVADRRRENVVEQTLIHGREVEYRFEGQGPLIVLVHGMAGSAATWDLVVPALAERFAVLALDLPGHGSSAKPVDGDYSLGGGVAMQFAYQFPSRCERLVLVGSGGLGREVSPILRALALPGVEYVYPVLFASVLRTAGRGVLGGLRKIGLRPSVYVDQLWQHYESLTEPETRTAFARTLRSVVDANGQRVSAHDRLPLAEDIPTLIVWGANDAIIPSHHATAAHATLPSSRVEIFEGVGHFPHCEDPERFVSVLTDFIDTTEPAAVTEEQFARAVARSATA
jgi:pimeloyl-ACP methyl ester carboxylesterase